MGTAVADRRMIFDACIAEFADGLYRYAFRMLGCDSSARDLVQETFVDAWQAIDRLSQITNRRAWLFTVLRRKIAGHWQQRQRRPEVSADGLVEIAEGDRSMPLEDQEWLQQALQNLPESWREPLLLVVMEQHTCQEAADLLGLPLGTVLSRIHRAKQQLRRWAPINVEE